VALLVVVRQPVVLAAMLLAMAVARLADPLEFALRPGEETEIGTRLGAYPIW
jgi:hypothetical protein